jgi:luciferase family oxidoreductase group 1
VSAERLPLSVLDLSPVPTGSRPSQALHDTLALARSAEAAGYHRYWLAEHHNIPSVVSSTPEVLIAAVAGVTSTIRVGSGGIMLPNHSPLKVAETFRVLAGLHPDRIDLGIGRAPGTDQRTALALRRSREALTADDFPDQYAEMRAYAEGFPAGHPFAPISAQPDDVPLPPVWILGSSAYGGQAAAALGTGFAYAGHFGSLDPAGVIGSYREMFQPSPEQAEPHAILALAAIVAETEERAQALGLANELSILRLRSGRPGPMPSPEEAAAYPWSEGERAAVGEWSDLVSIGTPVQVAADLDRRARVAGADELIITTSIHDPAERRHSYDLLASAWGLKPR